MAEMSALLTRWGAIELCRRLRQRIAVCGNLRVQISPLLAGVFRGLSVLQGRGRGGTASCLLWWLGSSELDWAYTGLQRCLHGSISGWLFLAIDRATVLGEGWGTAMW